MSSNGRFAFRVRARLGLEGREAAIMWEHGCRGVVDDGDELVGYFDRQTSLPLEGHWLELAEDDYLERYYRELDCVVVEPLVIAPTHREASLTAGQKPLWIDPGMAFGTGHHETTRLALEALAGLDLAGKSVLDVGAGSGILAIAADLLGAAAARGIDIDADTVPIARENARLNRSRALFSHSSITREDMAHVIVANLHAELHVELAPSYGASLPPGGQLYVTGILTERIAMVEQALQGQFELQGRRSAGEWLLLAGRRRAGER
ncbi:MAG: 50S ribosomal protein L11 methyltransferase [Trueperaceae bacterium]